MHVIFLQEDSSIDTNIRTNIVPAISAFNQTHKLFSFIILVFLLVS